MEFAQLKSKAKQQLKGNVWSFFGITFVLNAILGFSGITFIGELILMGPIELGTMMLAVEIFNNNECHFNTGFKGFAQFGEAFLTWLLSGIFVLLWSCLLWIPGIIAMYRYALVYNIIIDNPGIGAKNAIAKSKEMMKGHKMELFLLDLSFIGWFLLSILTFGLLLIYVVPYWKTTRVAFYEEIKSSSASSTQDFSANANNEQVV